MSTASEHYENLLAEHYSWMFGDFNARVEANRAFFSTRGIAPKKSGPAIDLGAGPGFQSIPLAQLGFKVLAIDLSQKLLDELKNNRGTLPITTVRDDLLNFVDHFPSPVELFVCMGDTLPHLESFDQVKTLFKRIYGSLAWGGLFVATFRDLTFELKGLDRFIPVRSDANTIFTCFLEYGTDHVQVHDLVYAKEQNAWMLKKSSYRKLRISLEWTLDQLREAGFVIKTADNEKGMITIVAEKRT